MNAPYYPIAYEELQSKVMSMAAIASNIGSKKGAGIVQSAYNLVFVYQRRVISELRDAGLTDARRTFRMRQEFYNKIGGLLRHINRTEKILHKSKQEAQLS